MILVDERDAFALRIGQYFSRDFWYSIVWNLYFVLGNNSDLCPLDDVTISVSRDFRTFIKISLSFSDQKFSLWLK